MLKIPKHFQLLLTEEQIAKRVEELAGEISRDYAKRQPLLVGVLKGSAIFLSDLIRHLTIPVTIDFLAVASYGDATESTGVVRLIKDLDMSVESSDVIVLEDIVDTGLTLKYIEEVLRSRKLASLAKCTLLDRPERRRVEVKIDYVGFTIPNKYVVGYGLDFEQKWRQLKDIYTLE